MSDDCTETTSNVLDEALEEISPVRVWIYDFTMSEVRRVARAVELVTKEKQDVLPIFIASTGGSLHPLLAMVDLLACCPVPVATVAIGAAQSCASVLLACGTRGYRYVGANTEVMVHPISDSISRRDSADVLAYAKQTDAANARFLGLLDKHTGHRAGYWRRFVEKTPHRDHYLTADAAVKEGIADFVGVPAIDELTAKAAGV